MNVKINRKDYESIDNIEKVVKTSRNVRIYRKMGYPRILIADCNLSSFLLRLVNVGASGAKIEALIKK